MAFELNKYNVEQLINIYRRYLDVNKEIDENAIALNTLIEIQDNLKQKLHQIQNDENEWINTNIESSGVSREHFNKSICEFIINQTNINKTI